MAFQGRRKWPSTLDSRLWPPKSAILQSTGKNLRLVQGSIGLPEQTESSFRHHHTDSETQLKRYVKIIGGVWFVHWVVSVLILSRVTTQTTQLVANSPQEQAWAPWCEVLFGRYSLMRFVPRSVFDWRRIDEPSVHILLAHSFIVALTACFAAFLVWQLMRSLFVRKDRDNE